MQNKTSLSFSVLIYEYKKIVLWSNPKCHGCRFEWAEVCEKFGIHSRSNATQCLFCVNNPNAVLPIKNYFTSITEMLKQRATT